MDMKPLSQKSHFTKFYEIGTILETRRAEKNISTGMNLSNLPVNE